MAAMWNAAANLLQSPDPTILDFDFDERALSLGGAYHQLAKGVDAVLPLNAGAGAGMRRRTQAASAAAAAAAAGAGEATSSYWRVPDQAQYLSALALHPMDTLCAVASGARQNNLFIYELGTAGPEPILTHHQTISLPHIHALQWVSPSTPLGSQGNVLVSGHKDGLVHMTLLPDTHASDEQAEILKRFNHQHHIASNSATRIRQLALTSVEWSCAAPSSIATLCAENLFLWNPARGDMPVLKQRARGITSFDLCEHRDGIVALGGRKGISIRDVRSHGTSALSPPVDNNTPVSLVRWSPSNENIVAAVHSDQTVKVWDIRAGGPLCSYAGHSAKVSSVEWSQLQQEELVSSSHDGTIRVWTIDQAQENDTPTAVAPPVTPLSGRGKKYASPGNDWSTSRHWRMYKQRRSWDDEMDMMSVDIMGPLNTSAMVSQDKQFVSMRLTRNSAVSIDTDGYFGFHWLQNEPRSPVSSVSDSCSDTDFLPPLL